MPSRSGTARNKLLNQLAKKDRKHRFEQQEIAENKSVEIYLLGCQIYDRQTEPHLQPNRNGHPTLIVPDLARYSDRVFQILQNIFSALAVDCRT